MSPLQDAELTGALTDAVREAVPELDDDAAGRVVRAVIQALDALGLLDELPPDFPENA
jgi:hypothetical protein